MIDRYTISASQDALSQVFAITVGDQVRPLYNAAPTQHLPIIVNSKAKEVTLAKWGFISSLSNNKSISSRLFNLSSELAFDKAPYQRMLTSKRGVVLADGFYLWKQVSKKQRIPYYFYLRDRKPFGIAAVWEQDDFDPGASYSFNMLTRSSIGFVREYQEDMPLVLKGEAIAIWQDATASLDDLKSTVSALNISDFSLHPVSPLISNIANEGESLIKPSQPSDQYGNYTLFN